MTKRMLSLALVLAMVLTLFAGLTITSHAAYSGTGDFVKTTGALESGYYVFTNKSNQAANDKNSSNNWLTYTAVAVGANDTITDPAAEVVWYFDAAAGTLQSYDNQTLYLNWPTTGNTAKAATTATTVAISDTGSGVYNITANSGARVLRFNSTGWRFYASTSSTGSADITFYKYAESNSGGHTHSWGDWYSNNNGTHSRDCDDPDGDCTEPTQTTACTYGDPVVVAATCSATGTSTKTCTVCGYEDVTVLAIDPNAHVDTDGDGICDECDAEMPNEVTADIVFSELGLTNSVQYTDPFDGGSFTVTFSGGGNDGKYYNTGAGIRVYANGQMTVAATTGTITKIVITSAGTSYAPTSSNCTISGGDIGYDGVTATWTGSADSVTFTSSVSHWRIQTVSVTVALSGGGHTHSWGDWYSNNNGTHSRDCDDPDGDCPTPTETADCTYDAGVVTTPATCIAAGVKTYTCSVCGYSYTEPVAIDPNAHVDTDGDGFCDECDQEMPTPKEYVLATSLNDGDEVVIYNPGNAKALSNAASNTNYRAGVDVTIANDTITDPAAAIVWTVEATSNGYKFKDADGKYLSVATSNQLLLDSTYQEWTVSASANANCVNIISTESAGTSGDLRGVEFYNTNFTTYYANATNLSNNASAFDMQLYVYAEPVAPSDEVTFYVRDENNSAGLNIYAFGGTGAAMSWPGNAMTFEGLDYEGKGIFSYTIDKTQYTTFIVNNGSGQTGDLVLADYATANKVAYRCKSDWTLDSATDFYMQDTATQVSAATCTAAEKISYTGILTSGTIEVDGTAATGHTAASAWSSDATGHWHACENGCGEKLDFAAHVDEQGDDGLCDICGYTMPTSKQAVIVADDGNGTYFAMSNEFSTSGNNYKEVSLLANGKISTSEADGCVVTLDYITETVFTISNGTNYLGWTSSTNFLLNAAAENEHYQWAEGENGITCQVTDGRWIRYNSGMTNTNRFRPYNNATGYKTYLVEIDNTPPAPLPEEVDIYVVDQTHDGIANIHYWGANVSTTWPGIAIDDQSVENLGLDKDGNTVYKFTLDKNDSGAGIIFSNNNGSYKTADLEWVATDLAANDGTYIVYYVFDGDGAMGASAPQNGDVWLASSKTTVQPTCTAAGYDKYVGLITGAENTNNEVPATGHTRPADASAYTFSNNSHTYTCPGCNESFTEACTFENGVCIYCGNAELALPTYEKVTAAPADWSGTYVLVYEAAADNAYVWNGADGVSDFTEAAISNGQISTAAPTLTIVSEGSGYSILINGGANGGTYLNDNGTSNGMKFSATAIELTIAYDATTGSPFITGDDGTRMAFNATSGQDRFRFFKTGTISDYSGSYHPVQLYKLVETAPAPVTASYSLTTGAKIGVNLYFQNLPAGAKVYNGETELTATGGSYTIDVAAKDYATAFVITAKDADDNLIQINGQDSLTVSAAGYIDAEDEDASTGATAGSSVAKVVMSMGNFCQYSAYYFTGTAPSNLYGDNDVGMGLASVTKDAVREELVNANLIPSRDPKTGSLYFYGGSLVLESETILRLYFYAPNADTSKIEEIKVNGVDYTGTPVVNGKNYIQIDIPLAAKEIGDGYSVSIKYDGNEASVANYSGLYYIWQTLKNNEDDATANEKLVNVVKSLYVYYKNALAYFGNN